MSEKSKSINEIFYSLMYYFKGDLLKTLLWLDCENPCLGNTRALDMIKVGREAKLLKFIQDSLDGNHQ